MNFHNPHIGKIEDSGNLVDRVRIDRYFKSECINLYPKVYIGDDNIIHNEDWLHDPTLAREHFNLKSIEFGNWMNQEDRANFLYASMLSFHHLAPLLGITDEQIGLNGTLSLALGARGHSRAMAHYEPNPNSIINLTKTKGIGSLAHEYAHALDNALSYKIPSKKTYVSGGRSTRKGYDPKIAHNGNWFERMFEEFFNVLYFDHRGQITSFNRTIANLSDYWNQRNEVFARTFEVYTALKLKNHRITNRFLVSGISNNAYPSQSLTREVSGIISRIVQNAFKLLENKFPLSGHNDSSDPFYGVTGYNGLRKTLKNSASLDDTLHHIERIARRDTWQVAELAQSLKGRTVEQTASNIWHFLRENTAYKLDQDGIEELRTPARCLVDGKHGLTDPRYGVDCDCYTILISAMLLSLGIHHEYRVTAYHSPGKFQHIYPVAFDKTGRAFIIDVVPEIPRFNYERPFIDLKTITMELHELSGAIDPHEEQLLIEQEQKDDLLEDLAEPFTLSGVEDFVNENDQEDDGIIELNFLAGFREVDSEEEADLVLSGSGVKNLLDRGILAEVNKARLLLAAEQQTPTVLSQTVNVPKELETLNHLMKVWDNYPERIKVIRQATSGTSAFKNFFRAILITLDRIRKDQTLNGVDSEPILLATIDMAEFHESEDMQGLGRSRFGKFLRRVGRGIKKGVNAVVRYNPLTIATRNAILSVLKLNMFGFSEKLIYGYLTEREAAEHGLNISEWRKVVRAKSKGENFFTKIGGKSKNFKKAIIKGKAAKRTGLKLSGLGEPATAAAGTAGASGFVVFMKKVLQSVNPVKLFRGIKNLRRDNKDKSDVRNPPALPLPFRSLPVQPARTRQAFTPTRRGANAERTPQNMVEQKPQSKLGRFFKKHKKKILIASIIGLVVIVIAAVWKRSKKKRKRSLAGIKAARTRAKNRRALPLKGSTTVVKVPTSSIKKSTRIRRVSNTQRLKKMHRIAKALQKKHPNTKYSTLLKRAAKQL